MKKTVKAWAVIDEDGSLKSAGDTPAIYGDLVYATLEGVGAEVVPCTITYKFKN